ncbi:MAG: hypothetical protein KBT39_02725 [Bacteroidales bacterium]|nr:hypothetical protein [Bacteroidales bacterium]
MKKQYMKPSVEAVMVESSEMVCGSGDGIARMGIRRRTVTPDDGDDDDLPEITTYSGYSGIFGD